MPMPTLENIPALVYSALWPLKVDGRLEKEASKLNLKILIFMTDFPPACLVEIHDGDFKVVPVDDPMALIDDPDANLDGFVAGKIEDAMQALDGPWQALKLLVSGKFKLHGKMKLWKLLKILLG